MVWWLIFLLVAILTLCYIFYNYNNIRKLPEGTKDMADMAAIIRSGANTFIRTEFRSIGIVTLIMAVVFTLFIEKTSGLTFLLGALMSSAVCIIGMKSATYANVRTANKAKETLSIGEIGRAHV